MSALILGLGYTGKVLQMRLDQLGVESFSTQRSPAKADQISFELSQPESWKNLPVVDTTYWTFPPTPGSLVKDFLAERSGKLGRIILIGSTGSYLAQSPDEYITENSISDPADPRQEGETEILKTGGILVRAAGIYGPNRNPLRWLESGRVASSPKFVNFIHVNDLAEILIAASLRGLPGSCYLASDGQPFRWSELIETWKKEFGIAAPSNAKSSNRPSKRVNPEKTLSQLKVQLQFRDVNEGVRALKAQGL